MSRLLPRATGLRAKTLLVLAIVLGGVGVSLAVVGTAGLRNESTTRGAQMLRAIAETYRQNLNLGGLRRDPKAVERGVQALRRATPALHLVRIAWRTDDGGAALLSDGHVHLNGVKQDVTTTTPEQRSTAAAAMLRRGATRPAEERSGAAHYLAERTVLGPGAVLELHYDLAGLDAAVRRQQTEIIVATIAIIFSAWAVISVLLGRVILQPLEELRSATRDLVAGEPTPLAWTRRDEIGDLAREFDRMAAAVAEAKADLHRLAMTDPVTGLMNRRAFDERLAAAVEAGAAVSLLCVDVDHFKAVNDERGHAAGDATLRAVADILRSGTDAGDLVARLGGDEFAVALPGLPAGHAEVVAQRLRRTMAARAEHHGVTLSMGLATTRPGADGVESLHGRADAALYAAKRAGRDRLCVDELSLSADTSG